MTSQSGKQTVAIHILPNISSSKGNQRMKFGQLIEYNMRNVFLEKSYIKCGKDTIPKPFPKNSKLTTSLDQYSKSFIQLVSIACLAEDYRNIFKPSC